MEHSPDAAALNLQPIFKAIGLGLAVHILSGMVQDNVLPWVAGFGAAVLGGVYVFIRKRRKKNAPVCDPLGATNPVSHAPTFL